MYQYEPYCRCRTIWSFNILWKKLLFFSKVRLHIGLGIWKNLLPTMTMPFKKDFTIHFEEILSFEIDASAWQVFCPRRINSMNIFWNSSTIARLRSMACTSAGITSRRKKERKKARIMAGLVFYFVCPSAKAAESKLILFFLFQNEQAQEQAKVWRRNAVEILKTVKEFLIPQHAALKIIKNLAN